jgi:hypothetical protein
MGLGDEVRYAAAELEDDVHGCAASNDNFVALRLLGLLAFATSGCLVEELLFSRAHLCSCSKLIEKCNGSFVIIRSYAGLCGRCQILDECEDIARGFWHVCQSTEDSPEIRRASKFAAKGIRSLAAICQPLQDRLRALV